MHLDVVIVAPRRRDRRTSTRPLRCTSTLPLSPGEGSSNVVENIRREDIGDPTRAVRGEIRVDRSPNSSVTTTVVVIPRECDLIDGRYALSVDSHPDSYLREAVGVEFVTDELGERPTRISLALPLFYHIRGPLLGGERECRGATITTVEVRRFRVEVRHRCVEVRRFRVEVRHRCVEV